MQKSILELRADFFLFKCVRACVCVCVCVCDREKNNGFEITAIIL